jgi:hypothetical protein
MWLGDLPRAVAPSWQVTQLPRISEWSNPAVAQDQVPWQTPQSFELGTCVAAFPVAKTPLWHEKQLPVISE